MHDSNASSQATHPAAAGGARTGTGASGSLRLAVAHPGLPGPGRAQRPSPAARARAPTL